jgi:Flp pilus assembly protein TadG
MRTTGISNNRRRGAVLATVAVALVALLSCAAMSVDYGVYLMSRQQLQSAVDAAALAGAGRLQYGIDIEAARTVINQTANANSVLGTPLHLATTDIEVGALADDGRTIVPWSAAFTRAVCRVTGRRTINSPDGPVPFFFARVFGLQNAQMTASAAAGAIVAVNPRRPVEIAVVQDGSGSFVEEWTDAMNADFSLFGLVNSVAMDGDSLSFVAFDNALAVDTSYAWVWNGRRWVMQYTSTPLYKNMTTYGDSRTALPSAWSTFKTQCLNHTPTGYTNPAVALQWAKNNYATYGDPNAHQQSIVLVSDGMPYASTTAETQLRRDTTVAAANELAALGVRIHTVTLTLEADSATYGSGGADFAFNESLVRNGGVAFRTANPAALRDLLIAVGTIEIGAPSLFE